MPDFFTSSCLSVCAPQLIFIFFLASLVTSVCSVVLLFSPPSILSPGGSEEDESHVVNLTVAQPRRNHSKKKKKKGGCLFDVCVCSLVRLRRVEPVDGAILGEICAGQGTDGSCPALAGLGTRRWAQAMKRSEAAEKSREIERRVQGKSCQ